MKNIFRELRIGNHVGINLKEFPDNYFTIVEVAEHDSLCTSGIEWNPKTGRHYFAAEVFEGIPLTPQWLERGSFKEISKLHPTFKKGNYIIEEGIMREGKYFLRQIINATDSLSISKEIKFVHTLQNIYYALTGTELTFKPA